jgi:catechol 2,3-dioxygenase
VSQALYLRDPDGNGVELYWDRPQDEWPRNQQGEIEMFTHALDLNDLLQERRSPMTPGAGEKMNPIVT